MCNGSLLSLRPFLSACEGAGVTVFVLSSVVIFQVGEGEGRTLTVPGYGVAWYTLHVSGIRAL